MQSLEGYAELIESFPLSVIISKKYRIWPKNEEILQTTLFCEDTVVR